MTNVFKYFGIQDIRDLAQRLLTGDPADLESRATLCRDAHRVTEASGTELISLADTLVDNWEGEAAAFAVARLREAGRKRHQQADQFLASATSFSVVAVALRDAQGRAQALVDTADNLGEALDRALTMANNAVAPAAGALNWGVKKLTGVDLKEKLEDAILELTRPILHQALGLNGRMATVIRNYEKVLRAESGVLRAMPGIVRTDAGPVDLPGDADLRRGALFRSVYGRDPVSANDKLMAEALDIQGGDASNSDPNARVVVLRIDPVPGAGVVHGAAFIGDDKVFNPTAPDSLFDHGDNRGFDPNAGPDQNRVSFYVDYETGVVVVRQNASHAENGHAEVGDPEVGVEQDSEGRVRLRIDAANPLAPGVAQDMNVSVRGDLVIDPHGGRAPAEVNGDVTRFPSWEVYQRGDDGSSTTLLTRQEESQPGGTGPLVGLPQPTVPVGEHPGRLDEWRDRHHPGQGDEGLVEKALEFPSTRGDDFYDYPVGHAPYPGLGGDGRVVLPEAHRVG